MAVSLRNHSEADHKSPSTLSMDKEEGAGRPKRCAGLHWHLEEDQGNFRVGVGPTPPQHPPGGLGSGLSQESVETPGASRKNKRGITACLFFIKKKLLWGKTTWTSTGVLNRVIWPNWTQPSSFNFVFVVVIHGIGTLIRMRKNSRLKYFYCIAFQNLQTLKILHHILLFSEYQRSELGAGRGGAWICTNLCEPSYYGGKRCPTWDCMGLWSIRLWKPCSFTK